MVLTITLNPSVDIFYPLDQLKLNQVNRVKTTTKTAGGKGINVARVLKELNVPVKASGFLGGYLGEFIEKSLSKAQIKHDFYHINQETRNCIAILHNGLQTEVLENGPTISESDAELFLQHFVRLLEHDEIVTVSGSLPQGLSNDYYSKLIKHVQFKGQKLLLDTSGPALEEALISNYKPYLIKPNLRELSSLLNKNIRINSEELKQVLNHPIFEKIEWVIVTLGSQGAFAKHKENFYKVDIPSIEVVNPVGSGDATVAGLAYGIANNYSDKDILTLGMTCGLLNTNESITGHINHNNIDSYYQKVTVSEI